MSVAEVTQGRAVPAKTVARKSIWQRLSSLLGMLVAVVFVMIAAVLIVIAVATRLSNKQQYTAFGHPMLVVLSGSMAPVVNTGDLIIDRSISGVAATKLHVGQIITFYDAPGSKTVINHRIVKVVHQGGKVFYETKGDANNAPDASLRPASDLIGIYETKIPRGGYFLTNIHRPLVLGLLLLAPILWLLADMLRRWAREEDEPKDPSDSDGVPEDVTA